MGSIILKNNGYTTKIVNGIPFSAITEEPNTNYLGFDPITNNLESLNPSGQTTSYGESFTGGTISGGTFFPSGLTASTISATTYQNLPCNVESVTYFELTSKISGSTLCEGKYYLISDFQTCYDQPDYNVNGGSITSVTTYHTSTIEPLLVLATSANTISNLAYQPLYPNDKITYDWTWNVTEVTNGLAKGRITERTDEFNNRTDYDHRNILFKRYRLFTFRPNQPLNGTIELLSDGTISGTNTSFTLLTVGDVVYIPTTFPSYYEIVGITGNTAMTVSGDTITAAGAGQPIFLTIEETNDSNGYFSYKRTNVKTNDFIEYTTFGDAISNDYAKNNYVGNYANIYTNIDGGTFILANNVFLEGQYESNKFGDYCYNNTWGTDNQNNIWGDWCYENVSVNDIDDNIIGHYFNNNLLNVNLTSNHIGNYFNNNKLLAENNTDFQDNVIGNGFNNNTIYSWFYTNEILNNFNNNIIGDFNDLTNFEFYGNIIGTGFSENTIRQYFNDNQIGNNFNSNTLNGDFYTNVIGNDFYDNPNIGYDFYGNNIGNGFNNNELIGDYFKENQISENFYSNSISYLFSNNQIGNAFENNTLGDTQFFNWDNTNIENLTGRTYNTFYNSLYGDGGNNVDNVILGKELIMNFYRNSGTTITSGDLVIGETYEITNYQGSDDFNNVADVISGTGNTVGCIFIATGTTPTDWSSNSTLTELTSYNEYHLVKFTQWTLGGNGGGFSYERTKDYPDVESAVYFTKTNYENAVDIIIPGRLEITRDNGGGAIYNSVLENSWDENVSPEETEWNSIYTQPFNGSEFAENNIFNDFKGNYIRGIFVLNKIDSFVSGNEFFGDTINNKIGSITYDNGFSGDVNNNTWQGNFYQNDIDNDFENNSFGDNVYDNIIGQEFFNNNIQNYFYGNTIGNGFQTNQIGSYFNNNAIDDYFGYGYGDPQGNKIGSNFYNNTVGEYFYNNTIPDNFEQNIIGEYFQWNIINTKIDNTDFTINYGNITGFSYTALGTGATDTTYVGISGTTSGMGINATFDIEVSGGTVIGVSGNSEGIFYTNGDVLTILGTQVGGTDTEDNIVITVTGTTPTPLFYEHYTKQIFEKRLGDKRTSFYDEDDILNIGSVYENSGYIPVYSQSLTYPIDNASFEFWCDGSFSNDANYTVVDGINNSQELITLFNGNFRQFGYFFDNNDGTIGLYINPSLKQQYCPTGTYTINVFND